MKNVGTISPPILSSAPGSPYEGQEYYNSTDHKLYYYNGTTWVDPSAGGGGHTQNTDTGTTASSFQIDSDGGSTVGVRLAADLGQLNVTNLAGTVPAVMRAAALGGVSWKQWQVQHSVGVTPVAVANIGCGAMTNNGTLSLDALTSGNWLLFTSAATNNSDAGIHNSATSWLKSGFPSITTMVVQIGVTTVVRFWAGWCSNVTTLAGTDSPTTIHTMAFRYSTSASDTQFQIVTSNGSNATVTSTGVTVAANTTYVLMIDTTDSAAIKFYIDGVLVGTATATLPTTTTGQFPFVRVRTLEAVAKTIRIMSVHCIQKG